MNDIYAFSYFGWFLVGISLGMGPCMLHHGFILLPFIGMTQKNIRQGFREFLYFHSVRVITYSLLGTFGGIAGYFLYNLLTHRLFIQVFQALLGVFLMGLAIFVLFQGKNIICHWTRKHFLESRGKAMLLAGFLTTLTPCPALLGLLAYTAASQRVAYGALAGMFFALGTVVSPFFLVIPVWGAVRKHTVSDKIRSVFSFINALVFFAFGFHLIFRVWLSL